jgi:hypothetical protein
MSAFQGFDIKLNLVENIDDRDSLNNLGEAPIADDIGLFLNNKRNTSELLVNTENRVDTTIVFNPLTQRSVFTNGTRIKVFEGANLIGEYFVGQSNATNSFKLYSNPELTSLSFPPAGPNIRYVRSDAVSADDLRGLLRRREPVVQNLSESRISDVRAINEEQFNIFTSFIRSYNRIRSGFNLNVSEFLEEIDSELDLFQMRKVTSLSSLRDFETDSNLSIDGNILISDPSGINQPGTQISTDSGPGIFILNKETNDELRIFSSNDNVWTDTATDIIGETKEIFVGNFVFDEGVRIKRKDNTPVVTEETGNITDFTHFVKVTVNGEEYSLCLK